MSRMNMGKSKNYLLCAAALTAIMLLSGCNSSDYKTASDYLEEGKYAQAREIFVSLGDYKDSAEKVRACDYGIADALLAQGSYEEAIAAFGALNGYSDSTEKAFAALVCKERVALFDAAAEDIITFGAYEQDNDLENGAEPIQWIVLERDGDKLFLLSLYALDSKAYNNTWTDVTWEDCTMRAWLNEDFYQKAFSDVEQELILLTDLPADANDKYNTDAGNDTQDKVFLLGITEARQYFDTDTARMCVPTPYAIAQGAWAQDEYTNENGEATCFWWLRSPGNDLNHSAYVHLEGNINTNGTLVSYGNRTARPAIWVDLSE